MSKQMVYNNDIDSQKNISNNIHNFYNLKKNILKTTENNAIIFTNRSDKFIFPERNVVYLDGDNIYNYKNTENFKDIKIPMYYFDNKKEISKENNNIKLESIFETEEYFLYKINFTNEA
jgi:Iap family predicted aminopeptidase